MTLEPGSNAVTANAAPEKLNENARSRCPAREDGDGPILAEIATMITSSIKANRANR